MFFCGKRWGNMRRTLALMAALAMIPAFVLILKPGETQSWQPETEESGMKKMQEKEYSILSDHVLLETVTTTKNTRDGSQSREEASEVGETVPNSAWSSQMEARMAARRASFQDACRALGLDKKPPADPWEYLINTDHHLVWCNVFKAASTSWMYNFNILAGYSAEFLKKTNAVPLHLARKRYPRPSLQTLRQAMNSSVSFIIVRHPLERLLSAYRDKIQNPWARSHHDILGEKIIAKYRKDPNEKSKHPTFPEFVHYLLDEIKGGRPLDMHWTPVVKFCTPCQLPPQIIVKFETLEEDQNYLIYTANVQDIIHPEWKNAGKGKASSDLVHSFYSQLTPEEIRKLYAFYRHDFQLFGYNLDGFLQPDLNDTQKTEERTE